MPKSTEVDRRAPVQRRKVKSTASGPESAHPPTWIEPQLTRLADEAPEGADWLHEIKYDGYRMHARIDGDKIQLEPAWIGRIDISAPSKLLGHCPRRRPDGELYALCHDGVPSFSRLQAAMDEGRTARRGRWSRLYRCA